MLIFRVKNFSQNLKICGRTTKVLTLKNAVCSVQKLSQNIFMFKNNQAEVQIFLVYKKFLTMLLFYFQNSPEIHIPILKY